MPCLLMLYRAGLRQNQARVLEQKKQSAILGRTKTPQRHPRRHRLRGRGVARYSQHSAGNLTPFWLRVIAVHGVPSLASSFA
jgi:hypothetical protein